MAGLIASCLAYGRVDLFTSVVGRVLAAMGSSPADFLLEFRLQRDRRLFHGIQYRFNRNEDILALLLTLHRALRKHGSLEALFAAQDDASLPDTAKAIDGFVRELLSADLSPVYGCNDKPRGLLQLFPLPSSGSACKRFNLFLRWMVRDMPPDLGIWKKVSKSRLVIPLDLHIMRVSRCLGFTKRASQDWKAALEITASLKRFDPEDPLKYDFALCHRGMTGGCGGAAKKSICRGCGFAHFAQQQD